MYIEVEEVSDTHFGTLLSMDRNLSHTTLCLKCMCVYMYSSMCVLMYICGRGTGCMDTGSTFLYLNLSKFTIYLKCMN